MTLHDAMAEVLSRRGGWMDRDEFAAVISEEALYVRGDGQPAPRDQLRLRAPKYQHLFECSDQRCTQIRLRGPGKGSRN